MNSMEKGNTDRPDMVSVHGREETLHLGEFLKEIRGRRPHSYDCLIHIDGSRASLARLYTLRFRYGMKPLGVTFNHRHYRSYQKYNILRGLEVFDIDHCVLTPRASVIEKVRRLGPHQLEGLLRTGVVSMTLRFAVAYGIPLVIWDESPSHYTTYKKNGIPFTPRSSLLRAVDNNLDIGTLLEHGLDEYDLLPYSMPEDQALDALHLSALFLEDFVEVATPDTDTFLDKHFVWKEGVVEFDEDSYWLGGAGWNPGQERVAQPPLTKYERLAEESQPGRPLYEAALRYCVRCCMPETAEALAFDELGMCQPCRSSEQKMHIDWLERDKRLRAILDEYRSKDGKFYDIMIPISGGKDSTFQLYMLTHVYGMRPLAVTFSHNWFSDTGRYNLMHGITVFDVDHMMFTPRRSVVNKLARKSLGMIGDTCWHCHAGVGAFPLQAAVKFGVRLLIWGESVAENDGRATYETPIVFDREYFTKISARYYAEEMVDENISLYDVTPYVLPSRSEIMEKEVRGIHLGDYIFWDDERQMEFVRDRFGWKEDRVEGTYKGYKSVECVMAGMHDYTKFIKRGYGRGTDHASQDVRVGLMTRNEGFDMAKKHDTERPNALDFYLNLSGFSEEEFEATLKSKREGKARDLP